MIIALYSKIEKLAPSLVAAFVLQVVGVLPIGTRSQKNQKSRWETDHHSVRHRDPDF